MSAPSIPNLLSLRGSRGGKGGLRGRGRGQNSRSASQADAAVQGTDTDAAVSRMSAVDLEYLHDPYATYFVSRADGPPTRRLPIINRGTYARTTALDRLIEAFLSTSSGEGGHPAFKQIISLGAGTDTRPFRIFGQGQHDGLVYHELDFAVTSNKKAHTVRSAPLLSKILTNISTDDAGNWSSSPATGGQYYCHGVDLRELTTQEDKPLPGLRTDIPTLLLSECCLCYLKEEESERVLKYFGIPTVNLVAVLYEPMHLDDGFGITMVSNLAARGIRMPGLEKFRNSNDQVQRLRDHGFSTVKFMTIDNVWDSWVDSDEKERVDGLEGLDEVEEWKLLAGHYIVSWAYKGDGFDVISTIDGQN